MTPNTITEIEPYDLMQLRQQGAAVDLVDVRTPAEFEQVHAEGARLFPLASLDPAAMRRDGAPSPVYLICHSGTRAAQACAKLQAAGVAAVLVLGGTKAWEQAGLPVVRGRAMMSLERQVRIAAGAMIVAGVLLGALVHPLAYALAALVGTGLVFAGITDTCGLAAVLARMPWNQRPGATCACTTT